MLLFTDKVGTKVYCWYSLF